MTDLPQDVRPYHRTPVFTQDTVPAALLGDHATKAGVWGRLHVVSGRLRFTWADSDETIELGSGDQLVIEPQERHRVTMLENAAFFVEFLR